MISKFDMSEIAKTQDSRLQRKVRKRFPSILKNTTSALVKSRIFDKIKEKGSYFEGSDKKYPEVELPRWMQEQTEEDS